VLQEYYHSSDWLSFPLIALVFFFLFFVAVLAWVALGMRDSRRVDRLSSLPFKSDSESDSHQESIHG
jgi:cbb3-type cytochrome oxidase subunit 3